MEYSIKNVKMHRGHEGEQLAQCTLYRGKKRVALYSDGDWGAASIFHWLDVKEKPVDIARHDDDGNPWTFKGTEEEAALWDHIKDMTWKGYDDRDCQMDPDVFVGQLIEVAELKKGCKNKVHFRIPNEEYGEGSYHTIKGKYEPKIKKYLIDKYGPEVEIINERFI
jgi:hypothetical protein